MITWRQKLGKPECPYMERWVFDFRWFSIRIHHWFFGDDPRHFHDHPWNFFGIVLKGSYIDVNPLGEELMSTGKCFYRKAEHRHTVKTDGCITLLITGPVKRKWGFWLKNKSGKDIWFRARRYFSTKGHHPCN
jgi:hypothetical protein